MPVSDWADLCPDTIVWEALSSRDSYGKPTYAAGVTFTGRRVYKIERVPSKMPNSGAVVLSSSTIWILGTPAVGYEDRVYVQGDVAPYPAILNVQKYPDESGDLYVKIQLGNAGQ